MKKIILFTLFALYSFYGFAQTKLSKWSIGIDLSGMSTQSSKIVNDDGFPTDEFSRKGLGYSFGITLQRNIKPHLSLSVGLDYTNRFHKEYKRQSFNLLNNPTLLSVKKILTEESIELPLLVHYRFGELPNRPRLKFVVSAGLIINSDLKLRNNTYIIEPNFEAFFDGELNQLPELNPSKSLLGTIAPTIGLGFNYQVNQKVLWVVEPFIRWDSSLRADIPEYFLFKPATTSFGLKSYLLFSL